MGSKQRKENQFENKVTNSRVPNIEYSEWRQWAASGQRKSVSSCSSLLDDDIDEQVEQRMTIRTNQHKGFSAFHHFQVTIGSDTECAAPQLFRNTGTGPSMTKLTRNTTGSRIVSGPALTSFSQCISR